MVFDATTVPANVVVLSTRIPFPPFGFIVVASWASQRLPLLDEMRILRSCVQSHLERGIGGRRANRGEATDLSSIRQRDYRTCFREVPNGGRGRSPVHRVADGRAL